MHPREFMDNFWTIEDTNRVFVMMAFAHHGVWKNIIEKAIKKAKLQPDRADIPLSGPIPDKILEGIFNARIILVDLSPQLLKDGKTEDGITMKYLYNWNVAYELGIAHAVRQKEEVILISQTIEKIPFDIQHWHIHLYDPQNIDASIEIIANLILNADKSIDHSRSLLVQREAKKLEQYCFSTLISLDKHRQYEFNEENLKTGDGGKTNLDPHFVKMAIYHMLELNIIETNYIANNPGAREYNYKITNKGKAVIEYLKKLWEITN